VTNKTSLAFNKNDALYSSRFNDIYFDAATGPEQNKDVFITGNNIIEQLTRCTEFLTIAETGFGTGLNFLLTLKTYQSLAEGKTSLSKEKNKNFQLPHLTFISIEKYPLSQKELQKCLAKLPKFTGLAEQLIEQYPAGEPSSFPRECELKFLNNKVTLKIIFDDATLALSKIGRTKNGLIDTWYLDGFSPIKNPEMWSPQLFEQLARLSKDQASLSSFIMTEKIRQQLIDAGFRPHQQPITHNNKEILTAKFQQNKTSGKGYQLRPKITKPEQVAIIGGGIASACAAYALTKQGIKVTLYCQESTVAQGASSNSIAAVYPLLHQKKDDISEFYQQAFWHAKKLYQELLANGFSFSHDWCGLLDVSYKSALQDRQKLFDKINAWPKQLIHSVDANQATNIAGVELEFGGLFMPNAGWVAPSELVEQLFNAAEKSGFLRIETSTKVQSIEKSVDGTWQLKTNKGNINEKVLIVCGGAETLHINMVNELPLTSVRGQITDMKTNEKIKNLSTILCHKGYLTPKNNNIHCIGATFDKDDFDTSVREKDDDFNLNMLKRCLPKVTQWQSSDISKSKARLRCMTPDHLPIVGAMPNIKVHQEIYPHLAKDKNWQYNQAAPCIENLYVMTGFGARGLCSAPLLADIIAADICGTPYPVNSKMLFNLSPNRFVIRDIIKGKT
jgi:tRNA 5-methylaminomethyl-2-thiouridine biosynthesis bifunctional protein